MLQYGTLLHWPSWANDLTRWNHLMLVINSSSNIIIYVAKDFKFRHALYLTMTCQEEEGNRWRVRQRTSIIWNEETTFNVLLEKSSNETVNL